MVRITRTWVCMRFCKRKTYTMFAGSLESACVYACKPYYQKHFICFNIITLYFNIVSNIMDAVY